MYCVVQIGSGQSVPTVTPVPEALLTLEQLQGWVEGYIEIVGYLPSPIERRLTILGNEDGRLHRQPPTAALPTGNVLVGALVIVVDVRGDFVALTPFEAQRIKMVVHAKGLPEIQVEAAA